ncbi:MAG: aminoglycoside phosphotransferase family protein [Actinomycetota bacterium]|nr:aminoglycoside phosphotransferase family protein [Actinomycetota bacterium]
MTLPARLPDGGDAVLKICFPHRESAFEADALERWDGVGAVRLLAHDNERAALLIERCRPGTQLHEAGPATALDVLVGLLARLWVPAGEPFGSLSEEASWWASYLPERWENAGRPFERRLLDAALTAIEELVPTQGEQVLIHQDLHGANVLRAQREPWLAIDPKPLVGEREFGVAPVVRSPELGYSERDLRYRLDRLAGDLELDRERARLWTLAQSIAWCIGGNHHERHAQTARWLLAA